MVMHCIACMFDVEGVMQTERADMSSGVLRDRAE